MDQYFIETGKMEKIPVAIHLPDTMYRVLDYDTGDWWHYTVDGKWY